MVAGEQTLSEFIKQNFELLIFIFSALIACGSVAWAIIYYLSYAVRSQVLGQTIWCGNAKSNFVALTFDDGPSPDTLEILDVLQRENVKATFFLIGKKVENYPEIAQRIVADGQLDSSDSDDRAWFHRYSQRSLTRRRIRLFGEAIGSGATA